jgi:predicted metal-dependent hydrolase
VYRLIIWRSILLFSQLQLGGIIVEVVKKDIKNLHLSVLPPEGAVRISAPRRMNLDAIRLFAISKLSWIKQQQARLREQEREPPREYLDRESHFVWGKRYLLKCVGHEGKPLVVVKHRTIELHARAGLAVEKREAVFEGWYRDQVRAALPPLLEKWQRLLGVEVNRSFVQRMKTKWGSSHPQRRNIRLNTELAKKPRECLEYVVVHELAHFISSRHDDRFIGLLNRHLPSWRVTRELLNKSSLRQEEWELGRS